MGEPQPALRPEGAFPFGENWRRFLETVDDVRIAQAERSLREGLQVETLEGLAFLDVGCGSGLFSLAARRLGARVRAFDVDTDSVECAAALRSRVRPGDEDWTVERGSALDEVFLEDLGLFDVVYAWGVLHHTGDLWRAMDLVRRRVCPGGLLWVAIYNDQGWQSRVWLAVKRLYNTLPVPMRTAYAAVFAVPLLAPMLARGLRAGLRGTWTAYRQRRGMSPWTDVVDWVGGYPFEVATPQEVLSFCAARGFHPVKVMTTTRLGCNEYVLRRESGTA